VTQLKTSKDSTRRATRQVVRRTTYEVVRGHRDTAAFAELNRLCAAGTVGLQVGQQALTRIGVIMAAKGGLVADVRVGDCLELLDAAAQRIDLAIQALRRIIADLRPAVLDDLGLAPAIETLVERVRASAPAELQINLICELERELGRLRPQLEDVIYRIAQEALSNAFDTREPPALT